LFKDKETIHEELAPETAHIVFSALNDDCVAQDSLES
jgi:hypothetical protein